MNKLLEVKEFDSIICNKDYKDDEKYKYLDKKTFNNLVSFIHEFSSNDKNADILNFMRIGYKRNIGQVITMRNYVGLIQMKDGTQIQILPKISFSKNDDADNKKTKQIFLNMLKSMKDFPSKVFNYASLKVDSMNLYELFINMYLQEIRHLIKRGIQSTYVNQEENLKYFKGKLLVHKQLCNNFIHKERFFVSFDEFNPNRPENRLIKATLQKLQKTTVSAKNSKEIKQLLKSFELVEPSINYEKDFSHIVINRNTQYYKIPMEWSKVFLMNKSFTTFSGTTTSRALLFPMESVYESYVARQIKKILEPEGWNVSIQHKGYYLFESPRCFSLRPDLVLKRDSQVIIMDTKWKSLVNNKRKNYGISQSDMYQMYAYSKKYSTKEYSNPMVWLLYPINDEMRNHEPIEFDSGDGTVIRVFFIELDNITNCLEKLRDELECIEL